MDRQPIEDIYKLIISDLEYAGNNLEAFYTGEEAGRVGSVAAKCLLGEVYVTMAGYPMNDRSAYQKAGDYFRADYGSGQNKICTGLFVYF